MILLQTTKLFIKELLIIFLLGNVLYAISPKIIKNVIKTFGTLICSLILNIVKHSDGVMKQIFNKKTKATSKKKQPKSNVIDFPNAK